MKDSEISSNKMKNSPANSGLHHASLDTFDKQENSERKDTHGVKIKTSREGRKRSAYKFKTLD